MTKKFMILCAVVLGAMSAMAQTPATDSKAVDCDGSVTITATPATGFHFVKWEDNATAPATRTISNIKDGTLKNYRAIFAADVTEFDESINPGDGVTLPVAHGTTLYLTPHTDDDCLEFDQWSDGNTDNPREFVYEGVAPTFVAQFKTKVYTITVNTDDDTQGSVSVTLLP